MYSNDISNGALYGEIVIHTSGKYYGLVDLTKSSVFEFSFNGIEFYFSVQQGAHMYNNPA